MIVSACLCWYDEPVEFLDRLTLSLGDGLFDRLYALDGAWAHMPHRDPWSPPEQEATIRAAAAEVGLDVRVRASKEQWESQVGKRAHLYAWAAEESDWIVVIDGDEYVQEEHNFRAALANIREDVAIVHNTRTQNRGTLRLLERTPRRVFRCANGLTVRETHNGVVTDDGRWLAGPRRVVKEPAADLSTHLRLRHEAWSRGERRNDLMRKYYAVRARERIEVHS